MATQKATMDACKEWQAADSMEKAVEAATKAAMEFDGLYDESAMNLLGRSPDLLLLLSAFVAGRTVGVKEGKAAVTSVQETLT